MNESYIELSTATWVLVHLLHKLDIYVIHLIAERDQGQTIHEFIERFYGAK